MTRETYTRVVTLLSEALHLLDIHERGFAAIYISHALESLGYELSDPDNGPQAAAVGS